VIALLLLGTVGVAWWVERESEATESELIGCLKHLDDPGTRLAALCLLELRSIRAVPYLIDLIDRPSEIRERFESTVLCSYNDGDPLTFAQESAIDEKEWGEHWIGPVLFSFGNDAVPALVSVIRDASARAPSKEWLARQVIVRLGPRALPHLDALINDESPYRRKRALFVLKGIAGYAQPEENAVAAVRLLGKHLFDADPFVRQLAGQSLWSLGRRAAAAQEMLLVASSCDDSMVAYWCLRTLIQTKAPVTEICQSLTRLAKSSVVDSRLRACDVVYSWGDPEGVGVIDSLLQDSIDRVALRAAEVLSELNPGNRASALVLEKFTNHKSEFFRERATLALTRMRNH
jgi:HEAT repeat protein